MFSAETFFQRAVKTFLWKSWTCLRYLEGFPKLLLCVSKKIVAVRHTNQIIFQEMWKKLGFWKNEAQMSLEYSNKTSYFEVKLFFQRAVKIFLWTLLTCSRYLEGSPNFVLCVSEKIGFVRHFNQNISRRKANGRVLTPPIVQVNLEKVHSMPLRVIRHFSDSDICQNSRH